MFSVVSQLFRLNDQDVLRSKLLEWWSLRDNCRLILLVREE
jgi:hypothetical protein